jgi:hypothetical protein
MNLESVSCEATNIIASVRASLQLNINYKPYFLKGSQSFQLIDKQSCNKPLTLDCQAESNPPANITWFKVNYNQQDNKFTRIKIGNGPIYTSAALNCGDLKVYKLNETIIDNSKSLVNVGSANTDFGLYVCEASNGIADDTMRTTIKRNIKLNPLGIPSARIVIGIDEESYTDETTTLNSMLKYVSMDTTITLTCIVDPEAEYKGVIWLYGDNKYLFDTKFVIKNSEDVDYDLLQELEQEENNMRNSSYKVNSENTKDGLKSYLQIKLTSKDDFGVYKCKTWNKYGNREISIIIKEEKYNRSLKNLFKIYEKYPILYIIGFSLLVTIIVLLISLIFICIFKRDKKKICFLSKKKTFTNSVIAIGVGSESSTSGVAGVHSSTSSSHVSGSGFNENNNSSDSKTIDEWLATTSKLNHQKTTNLHHPAHCLVVSYNENNNKNQNENDLLLHKSTPLTILKNYNLIKNNNDDDGDDSDTSFNKLLSETTYRLSDLFKDLSPSLINNNNSSENTLKRYKSSLSKPAPTTISTTTSSTSITTVTTNLSNNTPSKIMTSKSPRLRKPTCTSTFLPPPPPAPPQYQTTIHSNMKNIPYTTLSKVYANSFYRPKNFDDDDEQNDDSFNEYSRLNDGLNGKNENSFQTIV